MVDLNTENRSSSGGRHFKYDTSSREEFQFENFSAIPALYLNSDYVCIAINSFVLEFLQIQRGLILGKTIRNILFELNNLIADIDYKKLMDGPYILEDWITGQSGERRFVRIIFETETLKKNLIKVSFIDLTLMKRNLETVIENESRYRTFANAIPQLAWMADANGAIFWHNERFFEFTSTRSDETHGFTWMELIAPEHREKFIELVRVHLNNGKPGEAILKIKNGSDRFTWCLVRSLPIKDQRHQVLRWFGTATPLPNFLDCSIPEDGFIADNVSAFTEF